MEIEFVLFLSCSSHLRRYEAYVDQKYKEHLKNQGKVDSVGTVSKTDISLNVTKAFH